jgi:hypothetical protein
MVKTIKFTETDTNAIDLNTKVTTNGTDEMSDISNAKITEIATNDTQNLPTDNTSNLSIPTIHICNGKLGGTGKSTAARLLCERYLKLGRLYTPIDSDSNYNVARAYQKDVVALWESRSSQSSTQRDNDFFGGSASVKTNSLVENNRDLLAEQIVFSHDTKLSYLGDRFLELIDRHQRDVVVSLPANDGLEFWLDTNSIDALMAAPAPPFKIVNWWISFGSATSQQMLVDFIHKYPHLNHVCVFNLGITSAVPNWQRFSPLPALKAIADQGGVKTAAILPWLSDPAILEAVDAGTPLHEILATGWQGRSLNPIVKTKIEKWRADNWRSFEQTGFLA